MAGLAPYNEAVTEVVRGLGAFLGKICMPAAEQFGLLLKDQMTRWQVSNIRKMESRAEKIYRRQIGTANWTASPRLVSMIVNAGSWTDNDVLQAIWAGLLVSSCSAEGRNEGNIVFINLLNQMTPSEVRLLNYLCRKASKRTDHRGSIAVSGNGLCPTREKILSIMKNTDIHQMVIELDHLNALGLINHAFAPDGKEDVILINPTTWALHLFVRSMGHAGSPADYFKSEESRQATHRTKKAL